MMRKVKVKGPKKSSTLKRMNINLYGDNVTTPKLELPTAQFGKGILGRTAQPDPGSIRSTTKTSAIEEAKARQEAKDQGLGKTIGLGAAGFLTGALSSIPIIGGAFEGLNEKVQEKDKSGAAGIASGIGKAAVGTTSAVLSGGTMGTGDIAEGVGDIMGGSSEIAYNKGNDQKSERLGKAEQAFDTIAPMADMASGFVGTGAEGAEGMFKGPEGFKGGMKSLLGGMPSAKFGIKLPLEMELMPKRGKKIDGYSHEENGVPTKDKGRFLAEVEGGEVITEIREEVRGGKKEGGIVFSDTTINSETGNTFSKDADKAIINSKDDSKEGETTRRLAEEELYRKQEREKINQGLVNRGEEMAMKKYKKGGSLKVIPSDNKGLPQLPESVRNQMGYMKSGGGLYANIHAKRKRIADGSDETMREPGTKGAPTDKAFERAKETAKETAMYGKKLNLPKMQDGKKILLDLNKTDQNVDWTLPQADVETPVGNNIIVEKSTLPMDLSLLNKNKVLNKKKDGEDEEEGSRRNITRGDRTQLAGNMVAPLANLAAMRSIRENTVDYGKDRSITREQRVSTADMERAARQEGAATRAGLTAMGNDSMKSAISAGTTKAIQDAQREAERLNTQLAMSKDQLEMQRSMYNVGQADKEAIDKQTRKDLATTTGLTAAEQTGKLLVDLGLTKNQGLTNAAQLKILNEAFPDYEIDADNMKAFVRKLASNGDITRFRTNPDN